MILFIPAFFGCITAPVMVRLHASHENLPAAVLGSNQVAVHCAHRPSTARDVVMESALACAVGEQEGRPGCCLFSFPSETARSASKESHRCRPLPYFLF